MSNSNTIKSAQKKTLLNIIKMMEEPHRTSVTLGRSDVAVVLPILKRIVDDNDKKPPRPPVIIKP